MRILYDRDLAEVPVRENGEPLVDLATVCRDIRIDLEPESRRFFGQNIALVRTTIAHKLARIQRSLPNGMHLVVCDAYRPVELQAKMYAAFCRKLRRQNPQWSIERVHRECFKFVAPVRRGIVTPHSTGGTVDVTLERRGARLDMGTNLGDLTMMSVTRSRKITPSQQRSRELLIRSMTTEGFCNYALEWWHWSIGDRYWARIKRRSHSHYGAIPYTEAQKWMSVR